MDTLVDGFREVSARSTLLALVLTAVPVAAVRTAVPLEYVVGLAVVPTVAFGPGVAIGAGSGVVLSALSQRSVGTWTVVAVVWTVGLPYGTSAFLRYLERAPGDARHGSARHRVGRFLAALAVAAACTLAIVAWATSTLDTQPFFTRHVGFLASAGVAAVVGSIVVFVRGRIAPEGVVGASERTGVGFGRAARTTALLAVGVGWYAVGTGVSVMTHDIRLFDDATAVRSYATDLFGAGPLGTVAGSALTVLHAHGDVIVAGFGAAAFGLVAFLWPIRFASRTPGWTTHND
jgi:hypothetical protein